MMVTQRKIHAYKTETKEPDRVMRISKASRFPPIYEPDRVGPVITHEDQIKTAASLQAVWAWVMLGILGSEQNAAAAKRIGKALSADIGRQWSLHTAMQYLAGQRASKAVQRWAPAFEEAGFTPARNAALIACAGAMVAKYRNRPINPEVFLELLDLPPDVIERVKAHAVCGSATGEGKD